MIKQYVQYWDKFNWKEAERSNRALKTKISDTNGLQQDSITSKFTIKIKDLLSVCDLFPIVTEYSLIEIVLTAVVRAFCKTWHSKVMFFDFAYSNKRRFNNKISPEDIVGWLSTVCPLCINLHPWQDCITMVQNSLEDMEFYGNGYDILTYNQKPLRRYPCPRVSINYITLDSSSFSYKGEVIKVKKFSRLPPPVTKSYRPYMLSGGIIIENNDIIIQWDFSPKVLCIKQIEKFTKQCKQEFVNFLDKSGIIYEIENVANVFQLHDKINLEGAKL